MNAATILFIVGAVVIAIIGIVRYISYRKYIASKIPITRIKK